MGDNITIIKDDADGGNDNDGPFSFTITTANGVCDSLVNLALFTGGFEDRACGAPATYKVTELAFAGWSLLNIECDDLGTNATFAINVPAGFVDITLVDETSDIDCTFENDQDGGAPPPDDNTIIIEKNVIGTDDTFDFDLVEAGGTCTGAPDATPLDFDLADTDSETLTCDPGTYTIDENVTAGYTLTDIDCTGTASFEISGAITDGDFDEGDDTVEVVLLAGETLTCIFENTEEDTGNIEIIKDANGANADFEFSMTNDEDCTGETQPFTLNDDLSSTDSEFFSDCVAGLTYEITEIDQASGYEITDIDCTGDIDSDVEIGNGSYDNNYDDGDDSVRIVLAAGETVRCTFTNDPDTGNITIMKDAPGGGSSDDFDFDLRGPGSQCDEDFTLSDNDEKSFTCDDDNDEYTISEVDLPSGWTLTDIDCTDEGIPSTDIDINVNSEEVTFTLGVGDTIECTFTNEEDSEVGPPTTLSFGLGQSRIGLFTVLNGERHRQRR